MTKAAILRRQCIRAKRTLIRRWPAAYFGDRFEDADGSEDDLLKGTPLYWDAPSYYYGESDCRPAVDELRELVRTEKTDWARLARESEIRWRRERRDHAAAITGRESNT